MAMATGGERPLLALNTHDLISPHPHPEFSIQCG